MVSALPQTQVTLDDGFEPFRRSCGSAVVKQLNWTEQSAKKPPVAIASGGF